MNWKWDADYMSYFELLELIKKEGYREIKCIPYWNPRFSFNCDLQTLNYDDDMLQLIKDADRCEVTNLYFKHIISEPDIVDEAKTGHGITSDDDEVHCTSEKFADNEVEVEVDSEAEVDNEVEMDNEDKMDNDTK